MIDGDEREIIQTIFITTLSNLIYQTCSLQCNMFELLKFWNVCFPLIFCNGVIHVLWLVFLETMFWSAYIIFSVNVQNTMHRSSEEKTPAGKNKLDAYFVIHCDVGSGCCVYMLYNDDCCRKIFQKKRLNYK